MKWVATLALVVLVVSGIAIQRTAVRAYSNSCIDFNLTGYLEGPDSVQGGVPATFSGYVSANAPVSYVILYGDGGKNNGWLNGTSLPFSHNHTYSSSGPYTITADFAGRSEVGDALACQLQYTTN